MESKISMSKAHAQTNLGFLGDDGKSRIIDAIEKNQFTLELTMKQKVPVSRPYDPYKERVVAHPTTNFDTFFHLLKGALGTGILAMPLAFLDAGYVVGTVSTVIIGFVCTYCVHMLLNCEYEICKRLKVPSLSYPEVAVNAVLEGPNWLKKTAPVAGHIVNIFLLLYQIGICCVYVVFVASNIKSITDNYTQEKTDVRLIMVMILFPLILLSWVRNLKYLAPFSTIGNFVTIVSFSIICYYLFREPLTTEGKEKVGEPIGFPLFFGTVMFSLEAIGVIFPLENEMKTPRAFVSPFGVLNVTMSVIVFLYTGMGIFGYLRYGDDILGSITLNLPQTDILAQCVKGMLAFSIFITHGLACFVAVDLLWTKYIVKRVTSKKTFWEYVVRSSIVTLTFLLAVAVPNLELFIALIGAFCLSFLGLGFPAIIETCVYWKSVSGCTKVGMIIKNIIILLFGVCGLGIGTVTSIIEIVNKVFLHKTDK